MIDTHIHIIPEVDDGAGSLTEAVEMLEDMCQKPFIDKTRYEISVGKHNWEIDYLILLL